MQCVACDGVGLRTLCIAVSTISPQFYETWKILFYAASTSLFDREKRIEEVAELIETVGYIYFINFR